MCAKLKPPVKSPRLDLEGVDNSTIQKFDKEHSMLLREADTALREIQNAIPTCDMSRIYWAIAHYQTHHDALIDNIDLDLAEGILDKDEQQKISKAVIDTYHDIKDYVTTGPAYHCKCEFKDLLY